MSVDMQMSLLADPKEERKKPTNLLSNRHPVHRWSNFIAGYSPELVSSAISEARLANTSTILDPFAGLGTTLVQGLLEGFNVIGAEANPFFADIAYAKCRTVNFGYNYDEVFEILRDVEPVSKDGLSAFSSDAIAFLTKLFPEESLRFLIGAQNQEKLLNEKSRPLFRLVVSCLLEELTSSQTDGVYKAPTTTKRAKKYAASLQTIEEMIRSDAQSFRLRPNSKVRLHSGSAVDLSAANFGKADLCVTSPPYLNNFDYAEMSRMELYFWKYASSWKEITDTVRSLQVPNTTTIPTATKRNHASQREFLSKSVVKRLDPLVDSLARVRKERGGSKDYNTLIYPYFAAMQKIFTQCHEILRKGAPIHVIIGDAYLYGQHIPTGDVTKQILAEIGFDNLEMKLLRTRGTRWILEKRQGAGTPIGEYEIYGIRT